MRLSSTLLALAAILAMTGTAQAASTSGTATATIVAPIAIEQETGMNFGSISPGTGTSEVASAGTVTSGDAVQLNQPAASNGLFNITGGVGETYSTAGSDTDVDLFNGPDSLNATIIYVSGSGTQTLDGAGTDTLTAQGTLTVPSGAVAGVYDGTYNVTVNYN